MTTFLKNPYTEARKKLSQAIFGIGLDKKLKEKFKHKKFSERFRWANTAFVSMGFVAQIASLITAFTMLTYLFDTIHIVVRLLGASVLVLAIEAIKRESLNDVMKGIFQYGEVELFPAVLAVVTLASSIYISVEGAKILPSLFIADAVEEQAVLKNPATIEDDYAKRIEDKEKERDTYRNNRLWQGRLARKDSKVIEQYNKDIEALQVKKDEALKDLEAYNEAAKNSASTGFEDRKKEIKEERASLRKRTVQAAVGFELLLLVSVCFSWWFYVECQKEKPEAEQPAEHPINKGGSPAVGKEKPAGGQQDESEAGGRTIVEKIASFVDYSKREKEPAKAQGNAQEVEKVKQEYTRICPQCDKGFIHKSHNHKYCSRTCMREANKIKKA